MRYRFLFGCLVLSGFCGLAFELLWIRLLSFTFGSTTLSFSTVLAVFFGGVALGAWLVGKRAAGLARPVRAYALIEILIGLFGLALYPVMSHLDLIFVSIDPGSGWMGAGARLAVAAPLLIVPTFLMGATLPIACSAMIHRDEDVGRATALIYGLNTLGGFLGAYMITYHLIPGIGVFRSVLVTVGINFLAGAIALVGERQWARERSPIPEVLPGDGLDGQNAESLKQTTPDEHRRIVRIATVLTFLGGLAFISYEVVWTRLFSAFLQGTVYGVGAVVICFLVGIATGSLLVARRIPSGADLGLWYAILQTCTVVSVVLMSRQLAGIALVLQNLGTTRSESLLPQHMQLLVVFGALAIPTICAGASFPLLVKIVESRAQRVGRALGGLYAANTLGAVLGALAAGFVLIPEVGSVGAVFLATALVGLCGALGGLLLSTPGKRRLRGLGVAALALLAVGLDRGFDIKLISLGSLPHKELFEQYAHRHQETNKWLVYFAEGRDGTVAVYDYDDNRSLKINGLGQGVRHKWPPHHILESLLVGMIPLAHVEAPETALVVGLGAGTTVEWLHELGLPDISVVEIEPRVVDAVDILFNGKSPMDAEGIQLVEDDARHHLLMRARQRATPYDLITSMPAHPWVASALFTLEFFELAKANLSPRGVFSTWFGTLMMDQAAVESLLRAFSSVFPHYIFYLVPEAQAYYLVGARQPLTIDMEKLARMHAQPSVREQSEISDLYFLPTRIYATGDTETPPPPEGVVNTDDSAFVEVHAPRASNLSPRLHGFLPREYLHPSLVSVPERHDFYVELLEHLLGSPSGRLPLAELPTAPQRSSATLDAIREILTKPEQDYFDGRIAMVEGQPDEARRLLDEAARGGGDIARRARKFAALTHPLGSKARLEALLTLELSTDVILEVMEVDLQRGLDLIPTHPISHEDDPAGWFLWKVVTVSSESLGAEDRSLFIREVGRDLIRSTRLNLLVLAERFSRQQGLALEAESFNSRRRDLAVAGAERWFQVGLAAGTEGRYQEAADAFWKANNLQPGEELTMRLLLIALMEIRDAERTERLKEEFRFIGKSESHIRALVDEIRTGMLVFRDQQGEER